MQFLHWSLKYALWQTQVYNAFVCSTRTNQELIFTDDHYCDFGRAKEIASSN